MHRHHHRRARHWVLPRTGRERAATACLEGVGPLSLGPRHTQPEAPPPSIISHSRLSHSQVLVGGRRPSGRRGEGKLLHAARRINRLRGVDSGALEGGSSRSGWGGGSMVDAAQMHLGAGGGDRENRVGGVCCGGTVVFSVWEVERPSSGVVPIPGVGRPSHTRTGQARTAACALHHHATTTPPPSTFRAICTRPNTPFPNQPTCYISRPPPAPPLLDFRYRSHLECWAQRPTIHPLGRAPAVSP